MADPMIDENGVPWCQDSCPSHDGKRCTETGFRPARICEPAVIALRAALAKAEAQLSFLSMAVSILPCGHTRENLVKGNQTRTDEGDCAICETLKALERAEARAEKAEAELDVAVRAIENAVHAIEALFAARDALRAEIGQLKGRLTAALASNASLVAQLKVEQAIPTRYLTAIREWVDVEDVGRQPRAHKDMSDEEYAAFLVSHETRRINAVMALRAITEEARRG